MKGGFTKDSAAFQQKLRQTGSAGSFFPYPLRGAPVIM